MNQRLLFKFDWLIWSGDRKTKHSAGRQENQTFCRALYCLVTKHFTVWPPCLMLFDRFWSCLNTFEGQSSIRSNNSDISFVFVFYGWCFVRLEKVPNMFGARMRPGLLRGLYPLFDLCFNRLATYFNISLFGHQTMFHHVWSPYISSLKRPLTVDAEHLRWFLRN